MRILFVTPYVPNLIRPRPYNLIRHLSARGHEVTALTLWSNQTERADAEALQAHCHRVIALELPPWRSLWNCLIALPTRVPLQSVYCWQPVLATRMEELIRPQRSRSPCDVVHVEHLRGARYGLYLKSKLTTHNPQTPVVWDSVDCISLLFQQAAVQSKSPFDRWLTCFELGRTRRYEGWLLSQFDQTLITSSADKHALTSPFSFDKTPQSISVLPNGVDLTYFKPNKDVARAPATLVVSGKMNYHANVTMVLHLVQNIMPHIWASRPYVKLCVVGQNPPREILALRKNPNISVTGTLSDIRPRLQQATIAVAPIIYGTGIQNKVLEAMACATPVVATPQAVSALDAVSGRDVLVSQGAGAFAETVLDLLDDPERQQKIGQAGRHYVETHHRWDKVVVRLEEIYHKVVNVKR